MDDLLEFGLPFLIVGGIIVLVIVLMVWSYYQEKKRAAAMAEAAQLMGFTYLATAPSDRLTELRAFELFNRGHSPSGRNLLTGTVGEAEIVLLDYCYTVGSGKNKQTHHQTVALLPGGAAGLPEFQLTPEHFFHRIAQLFGYQDIDFDENPTFSKRYLLRGANEEAIRQAFRTEVLDFFAEHWGWSVESRGGHLLVYRAANRCEPARCPEFVAEAARIREVLRPPTSA